MSKSTMSTIDLTANLTAMIFRPYGASRWTELQRYIVEWRHRTRSRRELMGLDHSGLRDIGLSRCDAEREGNKPFWRA
jgi:uncharacterized protein YjiS (DUF1127 family)